MSDGGPEQTAIKWWVHEASAREIMRLKQQIDRLTQANADLRQTNKRLVAQLKESQDTVSRLKKKAAADEYEYNMAAMSRSVLLIKNK